MLNFYKDIINMTCILHKETPPRLSLPKFLIILPSVKFQNMLES